MPPQAVTVTFKTEVLGRKAAWDKSGDYFRILHGCTWSSQSEHRAVLLLSCQFLSGLGYCFCRASHPDDALPLFRL